MVASRTMRVLISDALGVFGASCKVIKSSLHFVPVAAYR